MKLFLSGDVDWESGADVVRSELAKFDEVPFLAERPYGSLVQEVAIFLICQREELGLRQRVRLDRKNRILYMDVMLDLNSMKTASQQERRRIVATRLVDEVSRVVSKYASNEFNAAMFSSDFRRWIESTGWLN
jgi:hypothetical protein